MRGGGGIFLFDLFGLVLSITNLHLQISSNFSIIEN